MRDVALCVPVAYDPIVWTAEPAVAVSALASFLADVARSAGPAVAFDSRPLLAELALAQPADASFLADVARSAGSAVAYDPIVWTAEPAVAVPAVASFLAYTFLSIGLSAQGPTGSYQKEGRFAFALLSFGIANVLLSTRWQPRNKSLFE